MIDVLRFAVRVSALSFALWRSRAFPLFFLYFMASLGDSLAEEIIYLSFGDSSPAYFYTYTVGTCLILLFALWLAWDSIPAPYRLRKCGIPAVLSLTVARMVVLGCQDSLNPGQYVLLIAGAILFLCGQILSTAAAYARMNHTALFIMGTLWLVQATYFFGYLLHAPEWESTGYWAPALLTSSAFLLVGAKLRQAGNGRGQDGVAIFRPK